MRIPTLKSKMHLGKTWFDSSDGLQTLKQLHMYSKEKAKELTEEEEDEI